MLKTKKSKQNVTILVLSVMLAIAAIFGVTAAWFISKASASGTVTTGAVQVQLIVGTQTFDGDSETAGVITKKENIVAGDTILDAVSFKMLKNSNAQGVYVRIKLEATGDLTVSATAPNWHQEGDYYYFGTASTKAGLTPVTDTNEHAFSAAVVLDTRSNAKEKNATITITIETVQVANQGDTIAWE